MIREVVKKIRECLPEATLEDIGSEVGVTRERIRQILKSEDLPTRAMKKPKLNLVKSVYSMKEVASLLGVHYLTVRHYVLDGDLPATRLGNRVFISRVVVDKILTGNGFKFKEYRKSETPSKLEDKDVDLLEMYFDFGWSISKISRITGLSYSVIKDLRENY